MEIVSYVNITLLWRRRLWQFLVVYHRRVDSNRRRFVLNSVLNVDDIEGEHPEVVR